ncbi:hypothetical protein IAU60_005382 [Kwoniella sp. DSM 27419]
MTDSSTPSSWDRNTTSEEVCATFTSEIESRVILVTGPTVTGIGYAACEAIINHHPRLLILAGRSKANLGRVNRDRLLQVDLSDIDSVKKAGAEVLQWNEPIDVLMNNAAVMDNPYTLTKEGHEIQFATNYLAPFVFTMTILPLVLKSTAKTVVNVSSAGHENGQMRWDDPAFKGEKGYNKKEAYGQSKTALSLFTRELAKRYGGEGLRAFSLNPGGISTPLQQHWSLEEKQEIGEKYGAYHSDGTVNTDCAVWKTPSQGASTQCRAAFDKSLQPNGAYMNDCQVAEEACKDHAKDPAISERLWGWTNELLGEHY